MLLDWRGIWAILSSLLFGTPLFCSALWYLVLSQYYYWHLTFKQYYFSIVHGICIWYLSNTGPALLSLISALTPTFFPDCQHFCLSLADVIFSSCWFHQRMLKHALYFFFLLLYSCISGFLNLSSTSLVVVVVFPGTNVQLMQIWGAPNNQTTC